MSQRGRGGFHRPRKKPPDQPSKSRQSSLELDIPKAKRSARVSPAKSYSASVRGASHIKSGRSRNSKEDRGWPYSPVSTALRAEASRGRSSNSKHDRGSSKTSPISYLRTDSTGSASPLPDILHSRSSKKHRSSILKSSSSSTITSSISSTSSSSRVSSKSRSKVRRTLDLETPKTFMNRNLMRDSSSKKNTPGFELAPPPPYQKPVRQKKRTLQKWKVSNEVSDEEAARVKRKRKQPDPKENGSPAEGVRIKRTVKKRRGADSESVPSLLEAVSSDDDHLAQKLSSSEHPSEEDLLYNTKHKGNLIDEDHKQKSHQLMDEDDEIESTSEDDAEADAVIKTVMKKFVDVVLLKKVQPTFKATAKKSLNLFGSYFKIWTSFNSQYVDILSERLHQYSQVQRQILKRLGMNHWRRSQNIAWVWNTTEREDLVLASEMLKNPLLPRSDKVNQPGFFKKYLQGAIDQGFKAVWDITDNSILKRMGINRNAPLKKQIVCCFSGGNLQRCWFSHSADYKQFAATGVGMRNYIRGYDSWLIDVYALVVSHCFVDVLIYEMARSRSSRSNPTPAEFRAQCPSNEKSTEGKYRNLNNSEISFHDHGWIKWWKKRASKFLEEEQISVARWMQMIWMAYRLSLEMMPIICFRNYQQKLLSLNFTRFFDTWKLFKAALFKELWVGLLHRDIGGCHTGKTWMSLAIQASLDGHKYWNAIYNRGVRTIDWETAYGWEFGRIDANMHLARFMLESGTVWMALHELSKPESRGLRKLEESTRVYRSHKSLMKWWPDHVLAAGYGASKLQWKDMECTYSPTEEDFEEAEVAASELLRLNTLVNQDFLKLERMQPFLKLALFQSGVVARNEEKLRSHLQRYHSFNFKENDSLKMLIFSRTYEALRDVRLRPTHATSKADDVRPQSSLLGVQLPAVAPEYKEWDQKYKTQFDADMFGILTLEDIKSGMIGVNPERVQAEVEHITRLPQCTNSILKRALPELLGTSKVYLELARNMNFVIALMDNYNCDDSRRSRLYSMMLVELDARANGVGEHADYGDCPLVILDDEPFERAARFCMSESTVELRRSLLTLEDWYLKKITICLSGSFAYMTNLRLYDSFVKEWTRMTPLKAWDLDFPNTSPFKTQELLMNVLDVQFQSIEYGGAIVMERLAAVRVTQMTGSLKTIFKKLGVRSKVRWMSKLKDIGQMHVSSFCKLFGSKNDLISKGLRRYETETALREKFDENFARALSDRLWRLRDILVHSVIMKQALSTSLDHLLFHWILWLLVWVAAHLKTQRSNALPTRLSEGISALQIEQIMELWDEKKGTQPHFIRFLLYLIRTLCFTGGCLLSSLWKTCLISHEENLDERLSDLRLFAMHSQTEEGPEGSVHHPMDQIYPFAVDSKTKTLATIRFLPPQAPCASDYILAVSRHRRAANPASSRAPPKQLQDPVVLEAVVKAAQTSEESQWPFWEDRRTEMVTGDELKEDPHFLIMNDSSMDLCDGAKRLPGVRIQIGPRMYAGLWMHPKWWDDYDECISFTHSFALLYKHAAAWEAILVYLAPDSLAKQQFKKHWEYIKASETPNRDLCSMTSDWNDDVPAQLMLAMKEIMQDYDLEDHLFDFITFVSGYVALGERGIQQQFLIPAHMRSIDDSDGYGDAEGEDDDDSMYVPDLMYNSGEDVLELVRGDHERAVQCEPSDLRKWLNDRCTNWSELPRAQFGVLGVKSDIWEATFTDGFQQQHAAWAEAFLAGYNNVTQGEWNSIAFKVCELFVEYFRGKVIEKWNKSTRAALGPHPLASDSVCVRPLTKAICEYVVPLLLEPANIVERGGLMADRFPVSCRFGPISTYTRCKPPTDFGVDREQIQDLSEIEAGELEETPSNVMSLKTINSHLESFLSERLRISLLADPQARSNEKKAMLLSCRHTLDQLRENLYFGASRPSGPRVSVVTEHMRVNLGGPEWIWRLLRLGFEDWFASFKTLIHMDFIQPSDKTEVYFHSTDGFRALQERITRVSIKGRRKQVVPLEKVGDIFQSLPLFDRASALDTRDEADGINHFQIYDECPKMYTLGEAQRQMPVLHYGEPRIMSPGVIREIRRYCRVIKPSELRFPVSMANLSTRIRIDCRLCWSYNFTELSFIKDLRMKLTGEKAEQYIRECCHQLWRCDPSLRSWCGASVLSVMNLESLEEQVPPLKGDPVLDLISDSEEQMQNDDTSLTQAVTDDSGALSVIDQLQAEEEQVMEQPERVEMEPVSNDDSLEDGELVEPVLDGGQLTIADVDGPQMNQAQNDEVGGQDVMMSESGEESIAEAVPVNNYAGEAAEDPQEGQMGGNDTVIVETVEPPSSESKNIGTQTNSADLIKQVRWKDSTVPNYVWFGRSVDNEEREEEVLQRMAVRRREMHRVICVRNHPLSAAAARSKKAWTLTRKRRIRPARWLRYAALIRRQPASIVLSGAEDDSDDYEEESSSKHGEMIIDDSENERMDNSHTPLPEEEEPEANTARVTFDTETEEKEGENPQILNSPSFPDRDTWVDLFIKSKSLWIHMPAAERPHKIQRVMQEFDCFKLDETEDKN